VPYIISVYKLATKHKWQVVEKTINVTRQTLLPMMLHLSMFYCPSTHREVMLRVRVRISVKG